MAAATRLPHNCIGLLTILLLEPHDLSLARHAAFLHKLECTTAPPVRSSVLAGPRHAGVNQVLITRACWLWRLLRLIRPALVDLRVK
jgi:hypothetical protein